MAVLTKNTSNLSRKRLQKVVKVLFQFLVYLSIRRTFLKIYVFHCAFQLKPKNIKPCRKT